MTPVDVVQNYALVGYGLALAALCFGLAMKG